MREEHRGKVGDPFLLALPFPLSSLSIFWTEVLPGAEERVGHGKEERTAELLERHSQWPREEGRGPRFSPTQPGHAPMAAEKTGTLAQEQVLGLLAWVGISASLAMQCLKCILDFVLNSPYRNLSFF